MRWECPNCGQAVSLGLDTCPNCQTGVPPEQRHKVVLPPVKGKTPELVPPEESGARAFFARGYHLFVGVLLAFLVIYLLWWILN